MGLLSKLFSKQPQAKGPRQRMCIQCGAILPAHLGWCPIGSEANRKKEQSA